MSRPALESSLRGGECPTLVSTTLPSTRSQCECCEQGRVEHHYLQDRSRYTRSFCYFIVIMACFARLSAAKPSLPFPSANTRICMPPLHTTCFFTSHPTARIGAYSTAVFARENETMRKSYAERQPQHQKQQRTRTRQTNQSRPYSTSPKPTKLEKPEIIYSNNHLLVVNKPAGWKSQPGDGGGNGVQSGGPDPKCLLTHLRSQSLGGGSQKDFLIPTHRLDQPCTGALIFAKNGKAASRVQVAWSKRKVKKCYWVVVEGGRGGGGGRRGKSDGLELLRSQSTQLSDGKTKGTFRLSAILKSTKGKGGNTRGRRSNNAGGSVAVKPLPPNHSPGDDANNNSSDGRVCHIEWEHLLRLAGERHLLSVTTDTGAKHQVRALLALAGGTPIAGDLRYGNNRNARNDQMGYQQGIVDRPLPDGSVALHARSVFLPTVSLGGMEFLKDKPFTASVPKQWNDLFGIKEDDVRGLSIGRV